MPRTHPRPTLRRQPLLESCPRAVLLGRLVGEPVALLALPRAAGWQLVEIERPRFTIGAEAPKPPRRCAGNLGAYRRRADVPRLARGNASARFDGRFFGVAFPACALCVSHCVSPAGKSLAVFSVALLGVCTKSGDLLGWAEILGVLASLRHVISRVGFGLCSFPVTTFRGVLGALDAP